MKVLWIVLALWGICGGACADPLPEVVVQTVAMEAANQSDYGQYLVASVIVNRSVVSHKSLEMVCKAPKQFSAWNDPGWSKAWLDTYFTPKARKQAEMALERAIKQPYQGITHYHTLAVRPYWAKGHKAAIVEGSHAFYDDVR